MKRFIPGTMALLALTLAACGNQPLGEKRVAITAPPPLVDGAPSRLTVPASCPTYAPGGGDVDTPEAPFPDHVTIMCAIDDAGGTYGIINGDAPTAHLAVVPGGRELGFYLGFDAGAGFTPDRAVLTGTSPSIGAWSAPTNVTSQDCCAEGHPDAVLAPVTVAVGNQGWLISLGHFDGAATQVALWLNTGRMLPASPGTGSWAARFYVNGPP
jgi:hypothetical protein